MGPIRAMASSSKALYLRSALPLYPALRHPPFSSPRSLSLARLFHSHEAHDSHNPPPPPFPPAETAILSAALTHVPTHGFTTAALSHGARDAGYLDVSVNLFPAGAVALVNYHLVTQRLALAQHHRCGRGEAELSRSMMNAEVRRLAWTRLQANTPIIHRWQEALALLAMPAYISFSVRELALLADEILFQAGDAAVDSSWYIQRAGLSAIYASAELFMTQDSSGGFAATEEFLARRLEGVERAQASLGMVGRWVGMQAAGAVNVLRSKGVRI